MAEIQVYLTLAGDEFDSNYVTNVIGLSPTHLRDKNELLGNGRLFGHCEWSIETELIHTDDLSDILDSFFSILPCNPDVLSSVARRVNAQWSILILIKAVDSFPAVYFSQKFLKIAAEIEADIGLDVYLLQNTDDLSTSGDVKT